GLARPQRSDGAFGWPRWPDQTGIRPGSACIAEADRAGLAAGGTDAGGPPHAAPDRRAINAVSDTLETDRQRRVRVAADRLCNVVPRWRARCRVRAHATAHRPGSQTVALR